MRGSKEVSTHVVFNTDGPTGEEELVARECTDCGWKGRMLRVDAADHPCPGCGRYLSLRPATSEPGR